MVVGGEGIESDPIESDPEDTRVADNSMLKKNLSGPVKGLAGGGSARDCQIAFAVASTSQRAQHGPCRVQLIGVLIMYSLSP